MSDPTLSQVDPSQLRPSSRMARSESSTEQGDPTNLAQAQDIIELLRERLAHQESRFSCIIDIGSALGSTFHLDELLELVMGRITELMVAERSTLYLLDEARQELWSKVNQGLVNTEIRLKVGEGLAGWVAATGKSINIADVYSDPRFHAKTDSDTGFSTRNLLCQPIRNQEGMIIGVIQVLNHFDGPFSSEDESLLSALSSQVAIAIENSKLYLSVVEKNMELVELADQLERRIHELDMLYEIEKEFGYQHSLEGLAEAVILKTQELFRTEGAALVLRTGDALRYYLLEGSGDARTIGIHEPGRSAGIAGFVIETGDPYFCNAAEGDEVPGAASELLGVPVRNVIGVPLKRRGDDVIGALKVFNRDEAFGIGDLKFLSVVASRVASAVAARQHQEELERSRRLASIGQTLSGVVHDLKNPFAVISGYVQLMARTDDREKRELWAGRIKRQFAHLNQMTGELLSFASGERHFQPRQVVIGDMLQELVVSLEKELEDQQIELELRLDYAGEAVIDDGKAKRAILNLVRNAADAMTEGGTIMVGVSLDEHTDSLLFTFADTGPGIPEAIQDSLFDEFVTHGKRHGTGLGLAIVKAVVDVHHGTIWFESSPSQGTTFFIKIPRSASMNLTR